MNLLTLGIEEIYSGDGCCSISGASRVFFLCSVQLSYTWNLSSFYWSTEKARMKKGGWKIWEILRVLMSQPTLFVQNLLNGVGISHAEYYFGNRRLAKLIHNPVGGCIGLLEAFLNFNGGGNIPFNLFLIPFPSKHNCQQIITWVKLAVKYEERTNPLGD